MIVAILFVSIGALCIYGVYRFFNPFGKVINEELSDSYYYSRDDKGVVYSPMGNWFSLGKNEMEVDLPTFQVLGRDYAKDANHAYFKSRIINTPVDVASFDVKSGFMPLDKNHVYILIDDLYYLDDSEAEGFKILEDADAKTYEQLSYDFARDKNFIYRNNEKCIEVDHGSFDIVNDQFCRDIQGVYHYQYGEPLLKIDDANISEIVSLTSSHIRDDKNVYFYLTYRGADYIQELVKLPFKNRNEIAFFEDASLLKIDDQIFYQGLIIEEVDAATFSELDYGYAKDINYVFFHGEIVEGADVNTFKYNTSNYTFSDKNYIYEVGKKVKKK
ncbi:DKNYY family protein [Aquimarina amphilecti]|uniref:DKNYY family protein n=1 Tax=Aquimarina amphilecti TaxID=1038014 RepID=A0A1H7TKQ1_AQUAM|nr:DKNYY domain-containing protein [Aquimarina amphilecti]SEL85268.1 DKNYY family protein [Aquimarina amphilecti]